MKIEIIKIKVYQILNHGQFGNVNQVDLIGLMMKRNIVLLLMVE